GACATGALAAGAAGGAGTLPGAGEPPAGPVVAGAQPTARTSSVSSAPRVRGAMALPARPPYTQHTGLLLPSNGPPGGPNNTRILVVACGSRPLLPRTLMDPTEFRAPAR